MVERLPLSEFESIRNLSSRVVRPENVLKPGERVVQRVLDPLEMKIIEVVGLGVGVKSISFGGQQRDVFEIKRSHASYELSEFKFADGLIYRVNMGRGYSRLKENHK